MNRAVRSGRHTAQLSLDITSRHPRLLCHMRSEPVSGRGRSTRARATHRGHHKQHIRQGTCSFGSGHAALQCVCVHAARIGRPWSITAVEPVPEAHGARSCPGADHGGCASWLASQEAQLREHRSGSLLAACVRHWRARAAVCAAREARVQAALVRCRVGGPGDSAAGALELKEEAALVGPTISAHT